jgi:hypothetical protein
MVIVDNTVYKPINKNVQKAVDAFVRKPIKNRIGLKWVQTARLLKKAKLIKEGNQLANTAKLYLESIKEAMVKPKSGHTYYQLTKDFPIRYIKGREGLGLEVPGVLLKNIDGYIDGKKGAYLIDYFGAMFYVDMKKKFAAPVYSLKDQNKFQRGSITQVDMAPEHSDWKRYIKENIKERINLFVEENEPTNPELWDRAIAAAKRKYDVYPSAYANAFASKWYKDKGGDWRTKKD